MELATMVASETQLPCSEVNNLNDSSERCRFIIDNGCLESESVIDYVYWVYCDFGSELIVVSILLIAALVITLFLALSSVADEFLCPSLLAVAKNLRMSDSLAGVTLLAFGNGCPDIFSSLAAASDDRSELIIGELLGAGVFCTSIVSGLIFIHSDFKLSCRPMLRDTSFYLLAVYLIWFYCWDGRITFYGSLAFILIYVIYLIVALSGQAIHSRLQGNYAITNSQIPESVCIDEKDKIEYRKWREESLRRLQVEGRKPDNSAETIFSTSTHSSSIGCGGGGGGGDGVTKISIIGQAGPNLEQDRSAPLEMLPVSTIRLSSAEAGSTNRSFVEDDTSGLMISDKLRDDHEQRFRQPDALLTRDSTGHTQQPVPNEWDQLLEQVNPINLEAWRSSRLLGRMIAVLRAPLVLIALLTIPVVDYDKRNNNWCRLLNALHCVTIPLVATLFSEQLTNLRPLGLPFPLLALLFGLGLAGLVLMWSEAREPPSWQPVFAYIGFGMSILWIYMLANEIISLLKTVGIIFSMTDTAIGLGILAWGNSLGDIVANISLAEAGYPRMAIGASVGAPLLNLLMGFGLAFTINLKPGQWSAIEYSPTITLLCATLALILLALMLSTLAPPERSKKPFGYLLIGCYGLYFALAVCLEYKLIKF